LSRTRHQIKFNPLANWTKADLDAYAAENELPPHPLVAQGFPSIGCWPCTKPVEEGQDARAGRWAGSQKPNAAYIWRGRQAPSPMSAATFDGHH
jgi:phosphoadenosine phosphosulfate reductase